MTDQVESTGADSTISPLPGEAGIPSVATTTHAVVPKISWLAVGLLILSLVAVTAFSIQRHLSGGKQAEEAESKRVSDRPSAATVEPRKLEMPPTPSASAVAPRIPALVPTADDAAEPISVRRTGQGSPGSGGPKSIPPEDAPVLLVTSRPGASSSPSAPSTGRSERSSAAAGSGQEPDPTDPAATASGNLQGYQRQLQGLLDSLTKSAVAATGHVAGQGRGTPFGATSAGVPPVVTPSPGAAPTTSGALFGGQLQGSATPRVSASTLGNRSLTLPKGTAFTCTLKTRIISATSGLVGCQVQRNVFSDDGRVLLIERGSHLDGEYRIASVRPGTVRIPVLWTRIRTPLGVTVDIDSPGTGQLGESGVDGHVDNRWVERIGAAMLLSLIDDSVKLVIQNQANDTQGDTVVLPSTTANTSKLAEKVLDSTINIPPLIYQNQGGIVGIYVARDVDFSSVYELRPSAAESTR
jgi:type IV secretion system protein VirB10